MSGSISFAVVTVTPEMAEEWLRLSGGNRRIQPAVVQKYGRDMEAGRWELNGEPIVFHRSGHLVEGHHRLWACLTFGAPFTTAVVTGASSTHYNEGKARTAADRAVVLGLLSLPPRTIKTVYSAASRIGFMAGGLGNISSTEADQVVAHYEDELAEAASLVDRNQRTVPRAGWFVACCALHRAHGREDASETQGRLCAGVGLVAGDPMLALRDYLMSKRYTEDLAHDAATKTMRAFQIADADGTIVRLQKASGAKTIQRWTGAPKQWRRRVLGGDGRIRAVSGLPKARAMRDAVSGQEAAE